MKGKIRLIPWLVGAGVMVAAGSAFAFDLFLQVDNLSDPNSAPKVIEISSYSFGISNPTTIGSGSGGAGAGKAKFDEFHITKTVDTSSAALIKSCTTGSHIKEAILQVRKEGGSEKEFLKITLKEVFVTSYEQEGTNDDGAPTEQLTLAYGAIEFQVDSRDGGAPVLVGTGPVLTTTAP
jgi:type VI secretion system secreted protein Hcp